MNKLKKVGLTALGSALVASSAYAGALSVTGGASMGFYGEEKAVNANGWTMTDSVSFSGGGEMDNGWNVTVNQQFDGSETNGGDDRSIVIDMGDSGTLTFDGHGGSMPVNAIDDKMPSANEETWGVVSGVAAVGAGAGNNDMFLYSNSSMMDNLTINLGYVPSDGTNEVEGTVEYGLTYTGIDGLTIGMATGDNQAASVEVENTHMYATYAMDSFTLGVQRNQSDSDTAANSKEYSAFGVSYAVSEDLSISYGQSTMDFDNASKEDQDASAVSFSYTMGSISVSGTHANVDNVNGTSTSDNSGYELNLTFAF